jgi:hypothetical protein
MHFSFPQIPFTRGRSKLNLLLFDEDWQSAIAEIECHPHETKVWSSRPGFFDGDHESSVLPIHVACSVHAPLNVIKAIVEAHPECVQAIESAFKRLPIHVACQFAARADVIHYLVEQYMAGTMEADILGRLPIHYACSNGAPLDVVRVLLNVNTSSTLYADLNGWIPLHVAVHFGAETEVVKEILDVSPPAIVNMRTKKGNTAMCLAKKITWKNKEEVLALLDNAHQDSAITSNLDGFGYSCDGTKRKQHVKSSFISYAA